MRTTPFEAPPLAGVQVVVTRAEGPDGPLARLLAQHGAAVVHWPVVAIEPPEDAAPMERALERIARYDGIVFTSPRAVEAVSRRVSAPVAGPWVAAVGRATADALAAAGWKVDVVPATAGSTALAAELASLDPAGAEILFPASASARDTVPRRLRALGATVDQVVAYRTVVNGRLDKTDCLGQLQATAAPVITFTSPSTVTGLRDLLGAQDFARLLAAGRAVAIGPTTRTALEEAGVRCIATARSSTLAELARTAVLAATRRGA